MTQNYYLQEVGGVEVLGGYRLRITFADGFTAELACEPLLDSGPVFAPLSDAQIFQQVRVSEFRTLEWPGGIDVSAGSLRAWCEAGRILNNAETDTWIEQHRKPTQKVA